jgi:hypothetical protein
MNSDRHRELKRISLADAPASGGTFEFVTTGNNLWEWLQFEIVSSHDGAATGLTFAVSYDGGANWDNVTFITNTGTRSQAASYLATAGLQKYRAKMRTSDKSNGSVGPILMRIRFVNSANVLTTFRGTIAQTNHASDD